MNKLFKSGFDLIIDDLVGDTSWHGETYSDNDSYENVEKMSMLLYKLIDKLRDNANLPENAVATASGKKLKEQAEHYLKQLGISA